MKVTFNIEDETVVTSNTVKVIALVTGQVGDEDRAQHEQRAKAITKSFLDADWAYSNFTYASNGMTFSVSATCRVPSDVNEGLNAKAAEVSDRHTTLSIQNLDLSVPSRDLNAAASRLRKRMLDRAQEAASELGNFEVSEIAFSEQVRGGSKAMFSNATYALDSGPGSDALGHSEKISLSAEVTVRSKLDEGGSAKVVPLQA